MATYYMRADGSAANKAAATGPTTDASKCMNVTVHNSQSFAAGDTIIMSDAGGDFTDARLVTRTAGTSGSPVTYLAEGNPVIDRALNGTDFTWTENETGGDFTEDFEGDLSAWTEVDTEGNIAISAAQSHGGSASLAVGHSDTIVCYIEKILSSHITSTVTFWFYCDPTVSVDLTDIVHIKQPAGTGVQNAVKLSVRTDDGSVRFRLQSQENTGGSITSGYYSTGVTSAAWHKCKIIVTCADNEGDNDGSVYFEWNDTAALNHTGLNNNEVLPTIYRFGRVLLPRDVETTWYFDDILIETVAPTPTGTFSTPCDYGSQAVFVVYDEGQSIGYANVDSAAACAALESSFYLDTTNDLLYINTYDDAEPDADHRISGNSPNATYIDDAFQTFDGITFRYCGVGIEGLSVEGLVVKNCTFEYGAYYACNFTGCTNPEVIDCTFTLNGLYRGGGAVSFSGGTGGDISGCFMDRNGGNELLNAVGNDHSWAGGVQWGDGNAGGSATNCVAIGSDQDLLTDALYNLETASGVTINYCLAIGGTISVNCNNGDDNFFNNMTCWGFKDTALAGYLAGGFLFYNSSTGNTMKNCIVYSDETFPNADGYGCIWIQAGSTTDFASDYDCLYLPNATDHVGHWSGTDYTFADWKTNSGQDAHSISADPLFANAGGTTAADYKITTGSPCQDAGTDVSLTEDYFGTTVPQGVAPDIGFHEALASGSMGMALGSDMMMGIDR
jgi:hypothetical protein